MKLLYAMIGTIKKDKQQTTIYCVADDEQDAIDQCSSFADVEKMMGNHPLGKGWNHEAA